MILDFAAVCHGADHIVPGNLPDNQLDQAIVHADAHPGLHHMAEIGITGGTAGFVPHAAVTVEGKRLPGLQHRLATVEQAGANLRALGVAHGSDGQPQLFPNLLKQIQLLQMAVMTSVGKVHPGNVHSAEAELFQNFLIHGGGPHGADNLCFAHWKTSLPPGTSFYAFPPHGFFGAEWSFIVLTLYHTFVTTQAKTVPFP